MSANRANGLSMARIGHLHGVTSRKGQRQSWEIGDVCQRRRDGGAISEMHVPDACFAQILFQFMHDEAGSRGRPMVGERDIRFHGTLR